MWGEVGGALQKAGDLSHDDAVEKVRGGSAKSGRCYYTLENPRHQGSGEYFSNSQKPFLIQKNYFLLFRCLHEDMCAIGGVFQRQASLSQPEKTGKCEPNMGADGFSGKWEKKTVGGDVSMTELP